MIDFDQVKGHLEEMEGRRALGDQATFDHVCAATQERFSAYLDGALDGRAMGATMDHLEQCTPCRSEFEAWRSMQAALGELGPALAPVALQAQLRDALASEAKRGTHLSPGNRLLAYWQRTLAPVCMRATAGFAAALLLLTGAVWVVGSAAPVQANDDKLADLHPPRYLYSEAPPEPVATKDGFVAVLVDAKVDAKGRVYDYELISGPQDAQTRARVESNLLASIFKPATVFGVPVPGHAMVTYTAVSVRG